MRAHARIGVAALVVAGLLCLQQLHQSLRFEGGTGSSDVKHEIIKPAKDRHPVQARTNSVGDFLGMELGFESGKARSSVVHCVGDNFLPKTASGYRSCQFRHLCWDLDMKDFVIFESPQHQLTAKLLRSEMTSMYIRSSSDFNTTVSTSATAENRLRQGVDGNWFPRKLPMDAMNDFYELPEDIVAVPVDFPKDGSMSTKDILFDFFLPVYNLLAMFDLQDKKLLLVNIGPTCEPEDSHDCFSEVARILPLMSSDASLKGIFMSVNDRVLLPPGDTSSIHSNFICAKYGATGIGALTDHGIHKGHGQRRKDYTFVRNSGRGPLLFDFRNQLLRNAGIKEDKNALPAKKIPLKIIFAISESKNSGVQYFQEQIKAVKASFASTQLAVASHNISAMPFKEQMKTATETSVYISVMGDGALPAFFLPRGATLILFYNDNNEFVSVSKRETTFPIKLDYDLWNNLGYIQVHWLPLSTSDEGRGLDIMVKIIEDVILRKISATQQSTEAENAKQTKRSAGTFNGMNLTLEKHSRGSWSHCIGGNFQDEAHALRSCEFHHLCLDLERHPRKVSLVASDQQSQLMNMIDKSVSVSTSMMSHVTLGQTIRFHEGKGWFPTISMTPYDSYYSLSSDVVWLPFYADQPNIHNPGHLLWDYFLPFFNLLAVFGLEDHQIFVSNIDDACSQDEEGPCWKIVTKFLPLLGVNPRTFRNTKNSKLELEALRESNIVCGEKSVAGIGMLTDHGWNRHGQRIEDYRDSHNVGRGPLFFAFRNFMIRKMGIIEQSELGPPRKIVFSVLSSKNPARRLSFEKQIAYLRSAFSDKEVAVEGHVLSKMSLQSQVKLLTETTVFISVVGGSACIGTFLPRGSSVILFFNDIGDEYVDHATRKDFPQMIDWDFWTNASYLRVHWLPMSAIAAAEGKSSPQALNELIRSEIDDSLNY